MWVRLALLWWALSERKPTLFSKPYAIDFIEFCRPRQYQDEFVLHEKFITQGLSAAQIAQELGCSKAAVKGQLRKFSIRKNARNGKTRHNLALGEKIVKGKVMAHKGEAKLLESIKDMHCKEGLSAIAIARILNSMKVPTKKPGKGWHHEVIARILIRQGVYQSRKGSRNSNL